MDSLLGTLSSSTQDKAEAAIPKLRMEEGSKIRSLRLKRCNHHRHHHHHHPDVDDDDDGVLPHDLVMENIIKRVRVKDLMNCGCVSKLWYNSICRDPHFASSYFLQSQKNPTLIFYLLNINKPGTGTTDENDLIALNLFHVREHRSKKVHTFRLFQMFENTLRKELVGNCNGLVCFEQLPTPAGEILIMVSNPSRNELLVTYPEPYNDGYLVCYGFGFDPLTKEYKVVRIFKNHMGGFKCMVLVVGFNTWREAAATLPTFSFGTTGISSDTTFYKSGVCCDGALFWRTKSGAGNETNLLLSFDLHDEKFQVIPLPAEFVAEQQQQQQQQLVDHLMEFNGSPCVVVILEGGGGGGRRSSSTNDHDHRHRHDKTNNCCCAKVKLYYLLLNKDCKKVEQKKVWIKKTFDVCIPPSSSLPLAPCCFYDNTSSTPTRVLSYSGRVLLYWFDGECVQFYDLHTKLLKVVYSSCSSTAARTAFENKKHTDAAAAAAAVNHNKLSHMDYKLSCHVENLNSFRNFIHEGAPRYSCLDELTSARDKRRVYGYLCAGRNSEYIYSFN